MIITQAEKVSGLLKRYVQLRRDTETDKTLRHRAEELTSAASSFEAPAKRVALLRERDWIKPRDIPEADLKKASESVAKIADLLATDPEGISTPVNRLVKGLEKLSKEFDALSENAWADVVLRMKPSVEEAVLKQAEQHDSAAETVRRIRSINKELNSKAPLDLDELHAIENRWEELKRLIAQLPTATDNPDVKRFLNAIRGGGGAPLSYLTDSVREYLTDEGLVESYHIYKKR